MPIKILKRFILLSMLCALLTNHANASCNTPVTITSARDGNWNTASTWNGGVVPSICDYVIINHTVTLNTSFTVGQNGTGGITINSGKTLSGSNTITIQGGGNYNVTNNGTLTISGLNMYSGSPGARFTNNGTTTINASINPDGNAIIHNAGTMTVNGNLTMNGATLNNYANANFTVTGILNLRINGNQSVLDNYGTINVNSNNATQALFVENGSIYNRVTGIINVPNGGFYEVGPASPVNYIYNENRITANYMDLHDNCYLENIDTIIINTDFHNNATTVMNTKSGYLRVGRDFFNDSKNTTAFSNNLGFVEIIRNFQNDRLINGTGGSFKIGGVSTNNVNGTITGTVDICDLSAGPSGVDNNLGYIGAGVTKCQYIAPCASAVPAAISGISSPCQNATGLTYSVAAVSGATNYTWSVPAGSSITSGQGTPSIIISAGTVSGNVSVTVTKACGTGTATKILTLYTGTPSQPGTIAFPPSTLCQSVSGYAYTITPVSKATSYTWSVPSGWTIINGQGTTTISVISGSTSGSISVTASNSCGTSAARTLSVSPSLTPSAPGIISMTSNGNNVLNNAVCSGQGFVANVSSVAGATDYIWSFPSGWNMNYPGSGNNCSACSYSVSGSTGSGSGSVTVAASNACGSSANSSMTINIVNGSVPATPVISGPTNPNAGSSVQYVASTNNATGFNWIVPTGWTITSGAGSSTITVTVGNQGQNGNITAQATTFCNGGTNPAGTKSVSPSEPLPVKLVRFEVLDQENYALLKWTTATELNNDYFEIQRSVNGFDFEKIGVVKGNGTKYSTSQYTFRDENYSSIRSSEFYYRFKQIDYNGDFEFSPIVGINKDVKDKKVVRSIYPMPFSNEINLEVDLPLQTPITITITDLTGKQLVEKTFNGIKGLNQFNITDQDQLQNGVYFINILFQDNIERIKIVKS